MLNYKGFANQCEFLKANPQCSSEGFFDYLKFFYCGCGEFRIVGYVILGFWLAALFYLLGNTAADYFCSSLEKLSLLLMLPPTVAGVTPSVGKWGTGWAVSLCVEGKGVQIDKRCFIRDICFFLFTLMSLTMVLVIGKVSILGAIAFVMIYVIYAFSVVANDILWKHARRLKLDVTPLLPVRGSLFSQGSEGKLSSIVLLDVDTENGPPQLPSSLPQWMWATNVAMYSNHFKKAGPLAEERSPWGWTEDGMETNDSPFSCSKLFSLLELPLTVPRRLTIPLVDPESWSKPYAVASVSLAPVLLAFLWNSQGDVGSQSRVITWFISAAAGCILGILAYQHTVSDHPLRACCSVGSTWCDFGINPSILGVTILAWGNSMGDLVSNVALAMNGGDSVQIALSGCCWSHVQHLLVWASHCCSELGQRVLPRTWFLKMAACFIPWAFSCQD
ncbi:Cation/calcium exchanger 4 [Hibiscus syriacus]|uniref:Cation/calcium exchanger 4 n=1 Tax=Hibiscus syriacus TaxID=106335 RepID=A0A6A2XU26_HIBSY|nr:Cation/calcium exchanger 4 [Hibiscus syriacus]